ncbi:MAG: hypothetical protein E7L01_00405 [Paenibacillus macerans]|uniref:Uncharacterized protein n=2 Tax=Paenibacillus macerans TaxID=44252 RepID=A0A090YA03_PAEMA|nr:hypothetical protein [Paenibacillus macerans]KFM94647.1 hypothetical protein DJ90_1372 [Paenibacillus macerans]MCY7557267.1 hypothetical protein [Paenibacillus macerans]MDU7471808.1 hypothetical protein [Paenibacillus macerans]MEC0136829.1 hypothetical protein [Paenibacillus macerans]MEC0151755.1 hypothetical protein [Paenibacillus macerans]
MATPDSMIVVYDRMRNLLPQVIQPAEQSIVVWEASARAMNDNVNVMLQFLQTLQQIISSELKAHREAMQATQAQEEFNQELDESAKKGNKLVEAFKKMDLSKIASTGKEFLGRILSDGAQQQTAIDQLSFSAGSPGAGQQIFDQTASQALRYGQDVDTAMAGTQKFMSITTDPAQLAELNMLAMRLERLNPGQGLEGAADALSQVLSGSTEGLGSFDISAGAIDNSGVQTAGQQGNVNGVIAAMDELLNKQRMTQATFEMMMDSPAVKWKRVVDTFNFQLGSIGRQGLNALGPMFDSFLEVLNSDAFKSFIDGLGAGLSIVGSFLGEVADGLAAFFGAFTSNGSSSYFIVLGIIAALGLMTIMLWAMVAPVVAQAIAWLGVYWPILLIAAGIALLIGVLMNLGVSAQTIVGVIAGAFYGFFAYLYNQFALLYNVISSFVEFWLNVFHDPVYAIKKLIYDLAMAFGGYMYNMLRSAEDFVEGFLKSFQGVKGLANGLIKAFNKVSGKDVPMIDDWNFHRISDGVQSFMNGIPAPEKPDGVITLDKMQYKNPAEEAEKGSKKAVEQFDKLANKTNSLTSGFGKDQSQDALISGLGGGNITNIGSVGNVGSVDRVNETVDISSEDLKMMRELAELKNIQNYVTLQPSISFGDTHVRQQSDINTIIAHITEKLEQDIVTSADAVYG